MSKIRIFSSTVVAVLILALGLWFLLKPAPQSAGAPVAATDNTPEAVAIPVVPQKTAKAVAPIEKALPASGPTTPDEDMISSVITSNAEDATIVDQLITLMPNLGDDAQAEAAAHIANLSDDKTAARWISDVVAWKLPAPAAEVLFKNLSNRPPEVAMPALAAIADNPNHPKHQEAIDMLGVLYDAPAQGSNWKQAVNAQLKTEEPVSSPD